MTQPHPLANTHSLTLSIGTGFLIALIAIVCLAAFIGIVMWAQHRPYFKRSAQLNNEAGGKGGTHAGDPRSVAPDREEVINQATDTEPPATGRPR